MTDETPNLPDKAAPSAAVQQRERMDALIGAVEQRADMLKALLADTGITFEKFVEVFRRALIRGAANPATDLMRADAPSVIEACINACTDGLLPDGRQGAIVLYNTKLPKTGRGGPDRYGLRANWQPMYQGLLDIAYASGNFRNIEARVVYDGDFFEYQLGDNPFINHRPKPRPAGAPPPAIVAAYAVARTVNGGVFREVFEGADIAKVNAVSRATNGPGAKWPEEMARKGPLRRMWKFLPKNEAMNRIVERDNDVLDLETEDDAPAPPAREKRLTGGFASKPAAIPQGADPVVPDMQEEGEPIVQQDEADGEAPTEAKAEPPPSGFEQQLAAAGGWLAVKQALKTFRKTDPADEFDQIACSRCWDRMTALREEGKDKTDFVADPILFECWLMGADHDGDAVEGNWAIVQQDKAYERLPEADRERIAARVTEALNAG